MSASRLATAWLNHQSRPRIPPTAGRDEKHQAQRVRLSEEHCKQTEGQAGSAGHRTPQHLFGTELFDGHVGIERPQPPAYRGLPTGQSLQNLHRVAQQRGGQPAERACCAGTGRDQQLRVVGRVGQVRGDSIGQGRPAERRRGQNGQHQPGRGDATEEATDHQKVHRNTRLSSGNRPIRSISR